MTKLVIFVEVDKASLGRLKLPATTHADPKANDVFQSRIDSPIGRFLVSKGLKLSAEIKPGDKAEMNFGEVLIQAVGHETTAFILRGDMEKIKEFAPVPPPKDIARASLDQRSSIALRY